MKMRPTVIERAFQLARTKRFNTIEELTAAIKREGYFDVAAQLTGPTLRKQLKQLFEVKGK